MKLTARDLKKLRLPLAIAAVFMLIAGVIAYASLHAMREAETGHRTASARRAESDNKLRQIRNDEDDIRKRSAIFVRMQQQGIFGDEKRLDWTEMLHDIQHRLRLPSMSYEVSPQKILDDKESGNYAFYVSAMKLNLNLVHEEDLLAFLAAVQQEAKAMVLLRSCSLARRPPAEVKSSLAQLSADCELDWITARKKEAVQP